MSRKSEKERGEISQKDLIEVVNSSIQGAIGEIVNHHPGLKSKAPYMTRHIDKNAVSEHVRNYFDSVSELGLDKEKLLRALGKNLANYVLSGRAFDEDAQEVILEKGLGERGKKERDYLGRVTSAFDDIYEMFKAGDYSERMPELARAVSVIHDYGFLDGAVDVLAQKGLMSQSRYKAMKKAIRRGVEEESKVAQKGIEHYLSRKIAAIAFGLIGLGFLVSTTKITAAAVGASLNPGIGFPVGIGLIVLAWILFLRK